MSSLALKIFELKNKVVTRLKWVARLNWVVAQLKRLAQLKRVARLTWVAQLNWVAQLIKLVELKHKVVARLKWVAQLNWPKITVTSNDIFLEIINVYKTWTVQIAKKSKKPFVSLITSSLKFRFGYIHNDVYTWTYMLCYAYTKLVTICSQIVKRPGDGIAGRDDAGDLDHQI